MIHIIIKHEFAVNFMLVLLSVCCINCEEPSSFCDRNYIDAVLWNGYNYRLVRDDIIADYDKNLGRIRRVAKIDAYEKREYRYQSLFRNTLSDNKSLNSVSTVLTAYSHITGRQYIESRDRPLDDLKELIANVLHSEIENPNTLDIDPKIMKDYQTLKPSTYVPRKDLLLFILNANQSIFGKTSATLMRKNYSQSQDYTNDWTETNITEGLLYTAAFYWDASDSVYIVAENRSDSERNGQIYRFDVNNLENPFIPLNQKVMEFFTCDKSQIELVPESDPIPDTDSVPVQQLYFLIPAIALAILFCVLHIALICIFCSDSDLVTTAYPSQTSEKN